MNLCVFVSLWHFFPPLRREETQRFSILNIIVKSISLILQKIIEMQIFYAPDITGNSYILDEKESKHLIRVLRMAKGSSVRLIDGKGNL